MESNNQTADYGLVHDRKSSNPHEKLKVLFLVLSNLTNED